MGLHAAGRHPLTRQARSGVPQEGDSAATIRALNGHEEVVMFHKPRRQAPRLRWPHIHAFNRFLGVDYSGDYMYGCRCGESRPGI
jgi:hypothetical protein